MKCRMILAAAVTLALTACLPVHAAAPAAGLEVPPAMADRLLPALAMANTSIRGRVRFDPSTWLDAGNGTLYTWCVETTESSGCIVHLYIEVESALGNCPWDDYTPTRAALNYCAENYPQSWYACDMQGNPPAGFVQNDCDPVTIDYLHFTFTSPCWTNCQLYTGQEYTCCNSVNTTYKALQANKLASASLEIQQVLCAWGHYSASWCNNSQNPTGVSLRERFQEKQDKWEEEMLDLKTAYLAAMAACFPS